MISGLERGKLVEDLNSEWGEVVRAIGRHARNTGTAKGQVKVTFDMAGDKDGQIIVIAKIESKTPKPTRGRSIRFTSADGDMIENDPRQQDLFDEQDIARVDDGRDEVARVAPTNTNGKGH